MSLVAEMLSKAKGRLEGTKDVPPELKDLLLQKKRKKLSSGFFVFLGLLIICSMAAGFFTIYYVHENAGKAVRQDSTRMHESSTAVTPKQEPPQPITSDRTAAEEHAPGPGPEDARAGQTAAETAGSRTAGISTSSTVSGTGPSDRSEQAAGEVSDTSSPVSTTQRSGTVPSEQEGMQVPAAVSSDLNALNNDEASSYIYSAMQLEEQRKYPEALAEYLNALKYKPDNPLIYNNISYLYLRMGVYETALQDAKKALALNSDYIPAMVNAGISLAALNRDDEAERLLKRAVTSEPYNRNALYNLGLLYEKEKRFKEALDMYQNLVNTGDYDAYSHMARVFEQSGRREDAIGIYSGLINSTVVSDAVKKDAEQRLGRLK
mgnify:CR=1 FL=1